jgi:hypothetical protein
MCNRGWQLIGHTGQSCYFAAVLLYLCAFKKEKEKKRRTPSFQKKVACGKLIFFLNELTRYCAHFTEQRGAASSLQAKQEHFHLILDNASVDFSGQSKTRLIEGFFKKPARVLHSIYIYIYIYI